MNEKKHTNEKYMNGKSIQIVKMKTNMHMKKSARMKST